MTTELFEAVVTKTQSWYDWCRRSIPDVETVEFASFAGGSNTFTYEINPTEYGVTLRLSSTGDTAFVDLKQKEIFLSSKFFTRDFYSKKYGDLDQPTINRLAVTLVNGCVIHEALHIKYTPTNFLSIVKSSENYKTVVEAVGQEAVFAAFNIIEDIFIESVVQKSLLPWIDLVDEILIPAVEIEDVEDTLTIQSALNLGVFYKNRRVREHAKYSMLPDEAMQILKKAATISRLSDYIRAQMAVDFLYHILKDIEPEKVDGVDDDADGKVDGDADDKADRDNKLTFEPMDVHISPRTAEILDKTDDLDAKSLREMSDTLYTESSSVSPKNSTGDGGCSWNELIVEDVMTAHEKLFTSRDAIKPENDNDYGFMRELVASRTVNNIPGQAKKMGPVMVNQRLSRIATDQKIFSKRNAQRQRQLQIEVIILIDMSGSTSGTLINYEVGAARAISDALTEANISNAVYGHTSLTKGKDGDYPFLMHIVSHDMLESNLDRGRRWSRLNQFDNLWQNYDGVILEAVAEKFTERNGERYLIALSDGVPTNGGSYGGKESRDHTRSVVRRIRQRGINIFSVSVVANVVKDNNNIYGHDYNINASGDLIGQFKRLVKKITA